VKSLDAVLLLALPASGKSEIRRYLETVSPAVALSAFGLESPVQIDDYPYVHAMRRISQESRRLGLGPAFFESDDTPFIDDRDWGTLTVLLDEDYRSLGRDRVVASPASWLLDRLDAARRVVGAPVLFDGERTNLEQAIAVEAERVVDGLPSSVGDGQTVVIEFARGGAEGSVMPLEPPFGYRYSLSLLSSELLEKAVIVYVWVTPAESRRKNRERARPGADGSILHHGVPEVVMRTEYGVDDLGWLLEESDVKGTVRIEAHGEVFHVPAARLDNRVDHTSFLRADPAHWPDADVQRIHRQLADVFSSLRERTTSAT